MIQVHSPSNYPRDIQLPQTQSLYLPNTYAKQEFQRIDLTSQNTINQPPLQFTNSAIQRPALAS